MNVVAGNLLDQAGIICQQVNLEGYMNRGLARDIRLRWPRVFEVYRGYKGTMGDVLFVRAEEDVLVANIYAQHYTPGPGRKTNYGALARGLNRVWQEGRKQSEPVFVPYGIGCGLGGGDWAVVAELIEFMCHDATVIQLNGELDGR